MIGFDRALGKMAVGWNALSCPKTGIFRSDTLDQTFRELRVVAVSMRQ